MILTICAVGVIPGYFSKNKNRSMHADTAGFVLVKRSGGVALYEKWNTLETNEPARELKAVLNLRAEMNAVAALIKDERQGMQWNKHASAYTVVPEGRKHWVCHIQYDLPWPVSNQDCVLKYTTQQASDTLAITFESVEHRMFPVQSGVTRIAGLKGKWVLLKTADGIKVDYFITTTPSKTFPRWVTDPIIRNNLLNTMVAFRTILEKQKG